MNDHFNRHAYLLPGHSGIKEIDEALGQRDCQGGTVQEGSADVAKSICFMGWGAVQHLGLEQKKKKFFQFSFHGF